MKGVRPGLCHERHGTCFSGAHEAGIGLLGGTAFLVTEVLAEALAVMGVEHYGNFQVDKWDHESPHWASSPYVPSVIFGSPIACSLIFRLPSESHFVHLHPVVLLFSHTLLARAPRLQ